MIRILITSTRPLLSPLPLHSHHTGFSRFFKASGCHHQLIVSYNSIAWGHWKLLHLMPLDDQTPLQLNSNATSLGKVSTHRVDKISLNNSDAVVGDNYVMNNSQNLLITSDGLGLF